MGKGLRVMIVENDAVIAGLFHESLLGMGYDVCAVESTEAGAVAAAARCRPDLMIVDAQLGEGSGILAVNNILQAGPVPHLFMSGHSGRIQGLRPGSIVIRKPFREAELETAIERVISDFSA